MNRKFVRRNITTIAILIYLAIFFFTVNLRPTFLFNDDGTLRDFGLGFRKKTVIPAWLLAISLAITSYFIVLYYLTSPKLNNF